MPLFCAAGEIRKVLTVYYLEFPPYYFTNSRGEPDGFLFKKVDAVFHLADILPVYESMPAKRILQVMHGTEQVASLGWFKTPSRMHYAKFSNPIYENRPLEALSLSKNTRFFSGVTSLADLLNKEEMVLGRLDGYSYGFHVDSLIQENVSTVTNVVGSFGQLLRMLVAERFTYMLVAPEEKDVLVQQEQFSTDLFLSVSLDDIPMGNLRYVMFSLAVPDEVVTRFNMALETLP